MSSVCTMKINKISPREKISVFSLFVSHYTYLYILLYIFNGTDRTDRTYINIILNLLQKKCSMRTYFIRFHGTLMERSWNQLFMVVKKNSYFLWPKILKILKIIFIYMCLYRQVPNLYVFIQAST